MEYEQTDADVADELRDEILTVLDGYDEAIVMTAFTGAIEDFLLATSPNLAHAVGVISVLSALLTNTLTIYDEDGVANWCPSQSYQ